MQDLEKLLIERGCERTLADYCHFIDSGQASRVVETFTEEGRLELPIASLKGREQIGQAMKGREAMRERRSRHVFTNFRCEAVDEASVSASAYLIVYRNDGDPERTVSPLVGPLMVGEATIRFSRTPDGWRMATFELSHDFAAAEV